MSNLAIKVGINGLGRIGRSILRQLWERHTHVCSHINDINGDVENIAYLILHDSVYGRFPGHVEVTGDRQITLQGDSRHWDILVSNHEVINDVDWSGTKCVIECSGREGNAQAAREIKADELSHVIVTHTFEGADFTLVFGVNEGFFDPTHHRIISSSICDASAIAPVLKTISDRCGLSQCFVTTLHPWLSYQNLVDGPVHSEAYRQRTYRYYPLGRASIGALIPKPTTVGGVLESLIPALKGRIIALSYRVPTAVVASADISLVTSVPTNAGSVNALLASLDECLIRRSQEMLVSVDYERENASAVIDMRWLEVRDEHFIKLVLWYDNEWGYSARVVDILDRICQ